MKKILVSVLSFVMVFTIFIENSQIVNADTTSKVNYQTIEISKNSLNGNTILGAAENKSGVGIGTDEYAFFSAERHLDGGMPTNGKLNVKGVNYQLACGNANKSYDGNDSIKLTKYENSQTMELKTIGVYEKIYVLATAGGPGFYNYARFAVTLNYTDGTSETTKYNLNDWYNSKPVKNVDQCSDFKRISKKMEISNDRNGPILHSAAINVNPNLMLKSIKFEMNGLNDNTENTKPFGAYTKRDWDYSLKDGSDTASCIYAITGATPVDVPSAPNITETTDVDRDCFTANWEKVDGATDYYIDVAKDSEFTNILKDYNNKSIGDVDNFKVDSLDKNTNYYYRIRAKNNNGQSLSSNVMSVKTAAEHVHSWKYESNGNIINAYCSSTDSCDYKKDHEMKATLFTESNVYNAQPYSGAHIDGAQEIQVVTGTVIGPIKYYLSDGTTLTNEENSGAQTSGGAPINAGKYIAKITIGGATATNDFEITKVSAGKANTVITTTDDKLNKTYDGKEIVDVESKSNNPNKPKIEYKKKGADDSTYTEDKPVNAGDYTVRVTYPSDNNYEESYATKDFTVSKAKVTVTAENKEKVYGDKDEELTYTNTKPIGNVQLEGITLSREKGENAGTYTIKASQKEGSNPNYDITFVDGTYTVKPYEFKDAKVTLKNVLHANGKQQTQEVDKVIVDGKELTKDDYDVIDNVATEPGTYTLVIKGKGNYTGEYKVTYVVAPSKENQINEDSKGNVVIGNGTLSLEVNSDKDAPETKIETNKADIINMLIENGQLSADELSAIANGADIDFILTVKDGSKTISKESKDAIVSNTKGYTVGQYIDISLYKYTIIDGNKDDGEAIHETSDKIKISIEIPNELLNKDSKVKRNYYIARNHDGKVEILKGVYDEKTHTYTFETDKFSDYAILYQDTKVETTKASNTKAENKEETKKVKTGDDIFVAGYAFLLAVSLVVMIFLRRNKIED